MIEFPNCTLIELILHNATILNLLPGAKKEDKVIYYCMILHRKEELLEFLRRNCTLKTNHLRHNIHLFADDITDCSSKLLPAYNGAGGVTVAAHYRNRHKQPLKYAESPCLVMKGGGNHKAYYPFEVINIRLNPTTTDPLPSPPPPYEELEIYEPGPSSGRQGSPRYMVLHVAVPRQNREFGDTF